VSRTGEATLQFSAVQAIDGDGASFWSPPPLDLPQSITFALAAQSRIDAVGLRTMTRGRSTVGHIRFDTSVDGVHFSPLKTIQSTETNDGQWFDVAATPATHIRVTIIDSLTPDHDPHLCSVLVRGVELEKRHDADITGCWSINGRAARFTPVSGVLELGHQPIFFHGGSDGRFYRFNWIRGNDYGVGALAVAPDGGTMSGIQWHEEAIPFFFGESWFGTRSTCSVATAYPRDVPSRMLQRTGRLSLFGLRFADDGSLDAKASALTLEWLRRFLSTKRNVRLVAHEFRQPTPQRNKEFAQKELDTLRRQLAVDQASFVAQGSDAPRQQPVTPLMRAMYSSVDLEIRR
jgi:F5/8 type C domain